jgi:hypothetical protein
LNDQNWSKRLLQFALPAIVLLFYFTASSHFSYTPDDTYIYLQFAKNFIHGNGISFNAGEPTYGITSPLWLFIISLGGKLGVDLYLAAKGIDLVFASLALIVFYLLAYEIIRDVAVALCVTVAFSLNVWFLRWAGTGMETSLSVFLLLATFLFCLRNEYMLSVVLAALLMSVRPETVLIIGFILVDIYINSVDRRHALKLVGALLLLFVVLLAPWFVYAYITFGTIIPNTALAKSGSMFNIDDIASTIADIVRTLTVSDGIMLIVFIASGILLIMKMRRAILIEGQEQEERFFLFRQSLIGVGWIIVLPLFYIVTDVNVVSRYLLLMTPLVAIYAYSFFYRVVIKSRWKNFVYSAVFLVTALVMMQSQIVYRIYVVPSIKTFEQGMEQCIIPIGMWLKNNSPPESVVFVSDIGAIGYYSERKVCDGMGLISPAMLALVRRGYTAKKMMEEKIYESQCSADYVVYRSHESEGWQGSANMTPLFTKTFSQMGLSDTRLNFFTVYRVNK